MRSATGTSQVAFSLQRMSRVISKPAVDASLGMIGACFTFFEESGTTLRLREGVERSCVDELSQAAQVPQ